MSPAAKTPGMLVSSARGGRGGSDKAAGFLLPTRSLLLVATSIAIELDHPAYDCLYIALAAANDCRFVTADERFLRKLGRGGRAVLRARALSLAEAVAR